MKRFPFCRGAASRADGPRTGLALLALGLAFSTMAPAQSLPRRQDDPIPPRVESMYTKGLRHLSTSQTAVAFGMSGSSTCSRCTPETRTAPRASR